MAPRADVVHQPLRRHQGGIDRSAPVREHPSRCLASKVGGRQHSGDLRPHRRSRTQPTPSNDDPGLHFPASRDDASADPGSGRRIPRQYDRGWAARRSCPRLCAAGALAGDLLAARRPLREARVLSIQQYEGTRRPIDGRGEGRGDRSHVRLHVGTGCAQRARTRRRPDEPPDDRLRCQGRAQPRDGGDELRDSAAGRPRNDGEHDLAGHRGITAASRRAGTAAPNRRSGLGRQHRRGVDALPDHRAHPGGPCRP